ncbi:uncharacterized protein LOC62_06G008441 [Vanrija pseudolonga]|uniref:Uncharacterized protein n=1 Tax=Vanrija pseudolonga TaxID=143232 RepID=A0AAF0YG16_9TREE|nr:hypothetical protein LOC62_06G008441 [Vanrija pseudolonga]
MPHSRSSSSTDMATRAISRSRRDFFRGVEFGGRDVPLANGVDERAEYAERDCERARGGGTAKSFAAGARSKSSAVGLYSSESMERWRRFRGEGEGVAAAGELVAAGLVRDAGTGGGSMSPLPGFRVAEVGACGLYAGIGGGRVAGTGLLCAGGGDSEYAAP